jgi:hypothetical protein
LTLRAVVVVDDVEHQVSLPPQAFDLIQLRAVCGWTLDTVMESVRETGPDTAAVLLWLSALQDPDAPALSLREAARVVDRMDDVTITLEAVATDG